MPYGAIDRFSEALEWKIPDFFSINEPYIDSPPFSLAGCKWYLRVYPRSSAYDGYVSVCLYLRDPKIARRTVTYTLGVKTADGVVIEIIRKPDHAFRSGKSFGNAVAFEKIDDLKKRRSELVPSDELTVTCRIERKTPNPEEVRPQRKMFVGLDILSSDFSDLLIGDRKYDVTVDVQGKEFRAHRTVLAARSPVFRAMYEHDTAEAQSGLLTIPDCDPDTFGDFLRYLYTGRMEEVSFQTAYHLYATAEKYDVQHLKSFCADFMTRELTLENVCDAIILADQYDDDPLMSSAQEFFNKNHYKIFLTLGWNTLLRNTRLASKLLKVMAAAALKSPCNTDL